MKGQYKSEIIQRIKDFKEGEREITTSYESEREKMKVQAQNMIDHISTIFKEALQLSEEDERRNRNEISQRIAEAEGFEQNLDQLIEKFETFTESAYISGDGPGIQLIDRSGTELDNISTDGQPSGLAVMQDGSLIYSDYDNKLIYKVSLNKEKTKLISTKSGPKGLCCTRSGDILVCMGLFNTARVVKYNSSGRKSQEFETDQNGESLFIDPWFICENVNEDICVSDWRKSKVVVLNKSGNLRFTYDWVVLAGILKDRFEPRGVAADILGHILIADANNAVHLISQDGEFLSLILTEDDGISRPRGISVDRSDNLWLVEEDNVCVKMYQYLF
ncbi:tripartite motif-containing protein 2-like [Saccostrea cucullata]|uniref:tripartite motif-containing protein 2-like n=1 Tax=Saccostrea cuccullata TaxID=36930 RepID=UPI002ED0E834